ncbi:hypothetical protein GCK72_005538 [Caenorhabditis remanei]|uniref:G-protein coupled receptors family 1 profile domain-containing protein n=1 Tax=Caenorhabditis remanei TaxID=31234 RepID=A0A6A5HFV4_CAERE|nr:hypothetical protein GCK72_005538 [Caenorhabditis remanei]KAF1765586.1 hypothetical protein GCK72_005538 [Caenorhabditis remanei]
MDTTTELMSAEEEEVICGLYEGYSTQRFIIITICTTVALFGVFANLLLMAVFRRSLPSSIFLATLATCDCLICLTYTLLFGVDAGIWYRKNTALFFLYHRYIVPVFFIAKVVQFAIPFILILITFERYLWTCSEPRRQMFSAIFNERGRIVTVIFVWFFSVALRFPVLYAMKVKTFPGCDDYFRSESVAGTSFAATEAYEIYDFHVITAIQMIFPFVVLLLLNFTIIKRLVAEKRENMYPILRSAGTTTEVKKASFVQGNLPENYVLLQVAADVIKESLIHSSVAVSSEIVQNEDAEDDDIDCSVDVDMPRHRPSIFHTFVLALRESSRSKRSQLRNAIYTMLAIVTSYLVCNGVHLFLTILERFDPSYLYDSVDSSQSSTFYIVLSDTVSICYMISSAIRILIYAKCNPKLRQEISDYVKREKSIETNSS